MADGEHESDILGGTVVEDSLCDDASMVDAEHVQVETSGISEEMVRQALAEAIYAPDSETTEITDTGQPGPTEVLVQDGTTVTSLSASEADTVINSKSNGDTMLATDTGTIFSNGLGSLENGSDSLYDGTNEVLAAEESNGTYTVDVGSLSEGQIISIPSDMMPGSVIISQQTQELQHTLVENSVEDNEILQSDSQSLIQQIQPTFAQQVDNDIVQSQQTHILQSQNIGRTQAIRVSAPQGMTMSQEVLQSVIQQVQAQQLAEQQQQQASAMANSTVKMEPSPSNSSHKNSVSFTLVAPNQASVANVTSPPLGSSQNPIRIIQQGNRYTPVQQLTPEQLQQIMQVVQQQHVTKTSQDNGGTVIFNPQTNTRIMYRVIYPSELHKAQNMSEHTTYQVVRPMTSTQEQQTSIPHQKRQYRKRKDAAGAPGVEGEVEGDKEKGGGDGPELSKEEKEERKKHRPRTRSGRVSKPPKHMVQDYKHIHVLDWDEDYDDSDGGYSDFKHSDEEGKTKEGEGEVQSASPEFFTGLGAGKPKNHKCQTCDKSYIGQAGLARHYRLNPDHRLTMGDYASPGMHNGSMDGDDSKDASLAEGSLSQLSEPSMEAAPKVNGIDNFSEDSNTQDSLNSTGASSPVIKRGRGRGGFRGRGAHFRYTAHVRRKAKLKEIMKKCSDEELMEVVLPRLVTGVSVWEFLLMKSEKGGARPQVDVIYKEFESLRRHVKKVCSDYLQPLSVEQLADENLQCKMIKVADEALAKCLDLDTVTYKVEEMPQDDPNSFSSLHNKLSAAAISCASTSVTDTSSNLEQLDSQMVNGTSLQLTNGSIKEDLKDEDSSQGMKRAFEFMSPEQTENPSKKPRLNSPSSVVNGSMNSMTVKGQLHRSDSSLSSMSSNSNSSLPSPKDPSQSAASHVSTSSTLSSFTSVSRAQLSSSQAILVSSANKSPLSSATSSVQIAKSSPCSRPQTVQYVLKTGGPSSGTQPQTFPVLLTSNISSSQVIGSATSTMATSMLPYMLSASTSSAVNVHKALPQKVVVAHPAACRPSSNSSHLTSGLLTTSSSSLIPGTSVLLASPSSAMTQQVVVRSPSSKHDLPTQVVITSQPVSATKKGVSLLASSPLASNKLSASSQQSLLTMNAASRSTVIPKPTEVKVSRQLFHDTTSSSQAPLLLLNGRGNSVNNNAAVNSQTEVSKAVIVTSSMLPHFSRTGSTLVKSVGSVTSQLLPDNSLQETAIGSGLGPGSVKGAISTLLEFANMSSEVSNLAEDDPGSLNTSTDSLNGLCSANPGELTEVAGETFSISDDQVIDRVVSLLSADSLSTGQSQTIKNLPTNTKGSPVLNGSINSPMDSTVSSHKFMDSTGSISKNHLSSSPISRSTSILSSSSLSSASDFIDISKSSTSFITTTSTDSRHTASSSMVSTTDIGSTLTNSIKSELPSSLHLNGGTELTDLDTSALKTDISDLPTSDTSQQAMSVEVLSNPTDVTSAEIGQEEMMDQSLPETESVQSILSEGTNIFQTEEGVFIIQSEDGNTYQLEGAQGLSLETVQALLSGTLNQLTTDTTQS